MISVEKLNERLSGDFDAIETILNEVGVSNIKLNYNKREIRCSREEGRNPSSIMINVDTLFYRCFSTGDKGTIYTLVMERLDKNFPKSLQWVAELLGIETQDLQQRKIKLPFGGFYKNVFKQSLEPELSMKTYNASILEEYSGKYNLMFNDDGIDYDTQNKFNVGYDLLSNRITIPQWDINGNLVGIMGRLNDKNAPKQERWLPVIPCQRSLTLYGYHFNAPAIQQKELCLIGESEKFVMQLNSMGISTGLSTLGCDISTTQAKHIKALLCKNLIVCFDEGLDEEEVRKQAKKLKVDTPIYKNNVGYIYDKDGDVLKKDSKASPTDLGDKALKELIKNNIIWI